MKKYIHLFLFLILLIVVLIGKSSTKNPISYPDSNSRSSVLTFNEKGRTILPSWNTYTNSRLGFTFQYPTTWIKVGKDVEVINLSGTITTVEINFADTASKTTLMIVYYLSPQGADIFRYVVSQFDSCKGLYAKDAKKIEIGGNEAIQAFTTLKIDGKGNSIHPPLRLIVIDFLDKNNTGEIEIQFKTPLPGANLEETKFRLLLSTFKFM